MHTFRKPAPRKSVMFVVGYDDGRTAYLWLDQQGPGGDDRTLAPIAKERQAQGALPPGTITSIKRVR